MSESDRPAEGVRPGPGAAGVAPARACPACGRPDREDNRFCGACGARLDGVGVTSEGRIDWDGAGEDSAAGFAEGPFAERMFGTVLFADIVGSTEIVAHLDAEQAMEALTPSVALMRTLIRRFKGDVMTTLGDGVLGIFGRPRAREGHALLACQAALAIQRAMLSADESIRVRVGLHSGELVVSRRDREPTAHGVAMHAGNRIESLAEPGSILISEACRRLAGPQCRTRPLGATSLRGIADPIELHALLGLSAVSPSAAFGDGAHADLLGREAEFERLRAAALDEAPGARRAFCLVAPGGAGKSRLCFEFAEWRRASGAPVIEARGLVSGEAAPLAPARQLIRGLVGAGADADDETVSALLDAHPSLTADKAARLRALLGFEGATPPRAADSSLVIEIVEELVRRVAARPGAIIVDDLHWIDAASAEIVAAAIRAAAGGRLVVLLNSRPPFPPPWLEAAGIETIPLRELDVPATTALVEALVGDDPALAAIRQRIAERSGGNPFFAEELVRALSESGVLAGEKGRFAPGASAADDAPLPDTIQSTVGARIDGLHATDKRLAHLAAIIGREFAAALLRRVSGLKGEEVAAGLDRLAAAGLVEPRGGAEGGEFAFRHPLIQEVAYSEQLKRSRMRAHLEVARALEAEGPYVHAAGIAHHYEAAGRPAEAAAFAAQAATRIGTAFSSQALRHWTDVRRLLGDVASGPERDGLMMRACGQIAGLGWREGRTAEEVGPYFAEAIALARRIDPPRVALLLGAEGRMRLASGESADVYVALAEEALGIAAEHGGEGRVAVMEALRCQALHAAGRLTEALDAAGVALAGAERVSSADERFLGFRVAHWMLAMRGRILTRMGRFDEARRAAERVLDLDAALHDPAIRMIPHCTLVDLAYFEGAPDRAATHAAAVRTIAEDGRNPYLDAYAVGYAGIARLVAGEPEAAATAFTRCLDRIRENHAALEFEADALALLAETRIALGDPDGAERLARQAAETARRRGARVAEIRAEIIRAAALAPRAPKAAAIAADRAATLIAATGAEAFTDLVAASRRGHLRVVLGSSPRAGRSS